MNSIPLRNRIVHAASWTTGGHVLGQFLRLASNLIMTRILVPEMFGVMAIANVVMIGLALMSDVGIRQHIIQSKNSDSEDFLNTAWVTQIARGGVLWIIALIISLILINFTGSNWWLADSVYSDPILPYVIAVLSFSAVIRGLESTKVALANRNLAMKQVVKIELISQASGIALMIAWTFVDRSIWALVAGALASSILKTILSHAFLLGHNNRIHFDQESFLEIFHFGKWVFITSILGFLSVNGDRLLLGGLVNSATLGVYVIAFFILNSFQQIITKLIGNVAFPVFSEVVRERPETLKRTYYKFRLVFDLVILLTTGFLFAAGHLIIQVLYDDRYITSGHMLEILCISLFTLRYSLAGQCFMAMGKPKLLAPIILIRVIILFVFVPIGFDLWGLDGALWVIGSSVLFPLPLTLYFKIKFGLFDIGRELMVLPSLVVGYGLGTILNSGVTAMGWIA